MIQLAPETWRGYCVCVCVGWLVGWLGGGGQQGSERGPFDVEDNYLCS